MLSREGGLLLERGAEGGGGTPRAPTPSRYRRHLPNPILIAKAPFLPLRDSWEWDAATQGLKARLKNGLGLRA